MVELTNPVPAKVPLLKGFAPEFEEWLEEQRKGKKTIAIVGFAPTSRRLAPYNDPDVEIWCLNEAYRHDFLKDSDGNFRADRWFQIHKPWSYQRAQNRNHPNHWYWLQNIQGECLECKGTGVRGQGSPRYDGEEAEDGSPCPDCDGTGTYTPKFRKDFPIYMQDVDPDVPGSVRLPLQEMIDNLPGTLFRGDEPIEYFTSSFAYQCAFALCEFREEVKEGKLRIEVYGYEMSTETEYHYQKGSTEFWLGVAAGMGVDLFVPHHCQLLKGAKYGYEVTQMINRQELEFRRRQLDELEAQKVAALNAVSGQRQKIEKDLQKKDQEIAKLKSKGKLTSREKGQLEEKQEQFQEMLQERGQLMSTEVNALSEANAVGGAMQEVQAFIAYIDAQYNFADAELEARVPEPTVKPLSVGKPTEGDQDGERPEETQEAE